MANLNVEELLREVNADGATRSEFYTYLRTNNPTFNAVPGEYEARLLFETHMNSANQTQRRVLAGTWLPEYNRTHRVPNSARADRASGPANTRLRNALTKSAVVGTTGLVAIVAGGTINNEATKTLVQAAGEAAVGASFVGALISYVRYR